MNRRKKLIIAILLVILIGLIAVIAGTFMVSTNNSELAQGNKTILVCAIDESEGRPGMGACDMAFLIKLDNGSLANYTPVYPAGLTHPNVSEPQEAQKQGAGSKLLLHDSFWENDNAKSMQLAKEIVEYNKNVTIDAVVAINTQALDALIKSAGEVDVNGHKVNASGVDIIREEQVGDNKSSRGDAVMDMVKAIAHAAEDPTVKAKMTQAAIDQYSKGNIVMEPQGDFMGLLASKGISKLFG